MSSWISLVGPVITSRFWLHGWRTPWKESMYDRLSDSNEAVVVTRVRLSV